MPSRLSCSHTFLGPVNAHVRGVDPDDLVDQPGVAAITDAGLATWASYVDGAIARPVLGEHGADRLDTPAQTTGVLVAGVDPDFDHDQRQGRSSSAATKADAAFTIELARRSSAFSRFSRLSSADSSLPTPARSPRSTSALAHPRAHRLRRAHPQQMGDLRHRRPHRVVVTTHLDHQPHRPSLHLQRVPPRRVSCHDPNLPKVRSLRTCRGGSTPGLQEDQP